MVLVLVRLQYRGKTFIHLKFKKMAKAIDFEQRNDFIGKPKDMTDNQCYALPVARIITHIPGPTYMDKTEQHHAHVSCWELSEDEIAEVIRTKKVYVKIISTTTYPFSVHGVLPIHVDEGNTSDTLFTREQIDEYRTPPERKN